jgi:TRAP-type C4-dicarboxylate transport system substrate-binding protein
MARFLVVLASLVVLVMPSLAEARVLKVNESNGPGSIEEFALQHFKKTVEERTKGDLEIRIFLNDQLGNPQTSFEGLMTGSLELYSGALEYYNALVPNELSVASLPFFLKDQDHLRAYLVSPVFEAAKDKLLQRGIRFISTKFTGERGPYRVLVSAKPVRSLADLQGLRIRMFPNNVVVRAWQHLGAVPLVISWQETYLAIRQGTISGVTGPLGVIRPTKFTEVAPFITKTDEWPQVWPITISERVWKTLTPEQQTIIVDAANEAGEVYAKRTRDTADEDLEFMKKNHKAELIDNVDLQPWRDRMKSFYEALVTEGVVSRDVIDSVRSLSH